MVVQLPGDDDPIQRISFGNDDEEDIISISDSINKDEEQEDSDTSYYYEETSSDEDEEDSDYDDSDDAEVELFDSKGKPVTDEELLSSMKEDTRPMEVKTRLLGKIRKYLKSINDSDGFECSHFPGYIWGLTNMSMRPRQCVIRNRDKYPEGYNHMLYLSSLAIGDYNKKNATKYVVLDIEKVSFSRSVGKTFYITFGAHNSITGGKDTFQSAVWDNIAIDSIIEVLKCRQHRAL